MEERKNCIFLVDDNIINLNAGKSVLQHKYTVITIPSGEKLLLSLKKVKPDLILLDIDMPDMDGYATIKMVKANPATADIPVIFLTGKNDSEAELLGLSLGAVDYITKPFLPPILIKRVELHLLLKEQKEKLQGFNDNLIEMVNERVNDIFLMQKAIVAWTAEVIEFRDGETGEHVERVQKYLEALLNAMEKEGLYSSETVMWDADAFLQSAPLHDIGKIKIRDDILLKKAKLSDEEFANMKLHSVYGKMLIESLQDKIPDEKFLEYAKILSHSHHERWDGTGYPDRLKGAEIPLQARMMSIADVYDALISERPYKKAFSHEEAMQIIAEGRGTQFDPNLTDLFISLSDKIKEISVKK